jgi:hypothetical protein
MNFNPMQFMQSLNQLKSQGGDPNQIIQQMLNSGKVTQTQYDQAVKMAQQIQGMLTPSGRR